MANPARLRHLQDVLDKLTADDHPTDLDDLQRLRDRKLIHFVGPSVTAIEAERLVAIIHVRDALGSPWTMPQLAFMLMLRDIQGVPPELAAEYIEKEVQGFFTIANRLLSRLGTDRVGRMRERIPVEAGMARMLARQLIRGLKLQSSGTLEVVRAFLENAGAVLIGAIYLNKPMSELASYLRRAVYLAVDAQDADRALQYVEPRLDEWLPSLRVSYKENQLLQDIRHVVLKSPSAVRMAVKDSLLMMRLGHWALTGVPDVPMPNLTKTNQYLFDRMIGPLPAVLAAMSLQDSSNPRFKTFYSKLRSGSNFGLRPQHIASLYASSVENFRALQRGESMHDHNSSDAQ